MRLTKLNKRLITAGVFAIIACSVVLLANTVFAADQAVAITEQQATLMKWAFLSAAISVGLGSLAAGIAVGYVGAAALGVVGERPEMAPRALIFVGLAEGIAIYGLILALMILGKV
ncbi:MAG: ATP synthase subunit C [Candidatus Auribacterota bacterium]|jgi:V/A-type H+-transporting ATPase subunit K|nr:ATP synthase subunit C [Candidatus Auribacterota bacterium]